MDSTKFGSKTIPVLIGTKLDPRRHGVLNLVLFFLKNSRCRCYSYSCSSKYPATTKFSTAVYSRHGVAVGVIHVAVRGMLGLLGIFSGPSAQIT